MSVSGGGSFLAGHVLGAVGPHADCHELLPGVNAEDDDIDAADSSSSSSSIRVVKEHDIDRIVV